MPIPRIHVDGPLADGQELDLPAAAARHVVQVLRLRPPAPLILFDGSGGEYAATLLPGGSSRVRLGARTDVERESPLALTLLQGISRGERMDYTIQKAVELGVQRIVPVTTRRSVVRLSAERAAKRRAHWQGVVVSACEQCGRARLPQLLPLQPHEVALHDGAPPEALRFVLAPEATTTLHAIAETPSAVALLVGPEGGLDDSELTAAAAAGWRGIRLGPRVLRTETAGAAALAVLQARWGDLA
jgi:16S rRNA (uracil1498-N3)-methyltransferase